jgi:hypothetical protein
MRTKVSGLAALLLAMATTLAAAQGTPPPNSTMSPGNSTAPSNTNGTMTNDGSNDKVGQDPKMKACMTSEKAKNTGQSDDQMKQKCMMQVGSHQGQSK